MYTAECGQRFIRLSEARTLAVAFSLSVLCPGVWRDEVLSALRRALSPFSAVLEFFRR